MLPWNMNQNQKSMRSGTMTEQEMDDLINDAFCATFWKYLAFVWSGLEEDY